MKAFVKLGLKLYLKLCIILELKGVETLLKMHKHQCRVDLVSGQQIFPPAFYWVHLRSSESNPALMCSLTCLKMLTCTTFFRLGLSRAGPGFTAGHWKLNSVQKLLHFTSAAPICFIT